MAWQQLQKKLISRGFREINLLFDLRNQSEHEMDVEGDVENDLVQQLSSLQLLDEEIGTVSMSDDVIDCVVEELRKSDE